MADRRDAIRTEIRRRLRLKWPNLNIFDAYPGMDITKMEIPAVWLYYIERKGNLVKPGMYAREVLILIEYVTRIGNKRDSYEEAFDIINDVCETLERDQRFADEDDLDLVHSFWLEEEEIATWESPLLLDISMIWKFLYSEVVQKAEDDPMSYFRRT